MRSIRATLVLSLALGALAAAAQDSPPQPHTNGPPPSIQSFPGEGEGAFKTGHYRDLFAEQGHTPAEIQAKLDKAFQQLFGGNLNTSASTSSPATMPTAPWPT